MKDDKKFNQILKKISDGEQIGTSELFPFIGAENRKERLYFNLTLANLYFNIGSYQHAYVCMQRAWLLSQFDERLIEQFFKIAKHAKKTEDIKNAYKQLGLKKLENKDLKWAIHYFNRWHYTETYINNKDKFNYDFDILSAIDNYTKLKRFVHNKTNKNSATIKIGYLVKDITTSNSVLVKINLIFAKFHNKQKFDVTFFIPETLSDIKKSPQGIKTISIIEKYNCRVITSTDTPDFEKKLNSVAQSIYDSKIDILITSAALSYFEHYYIISFKPAPIIIGLAQGPPPQFISTNHMDWSISWTYHPLFDAPINSSHISLEMDFPNVIKEKTNYLKDLKIPDNGLVLISGGRHVKFQDENYWNFISQLLSDYSNIYFIVIGPKKDQINNFENLILSNLEQRIKFLGWQEKYLELLSIADIVIDTFPSGGGVFLLEAMNFGIPILTFENNYLKEFDQTDWSPISEFILNKEILCKRGDFKQLREKAKYLIENEDYRKKLGEKCKTEINLNFGNPERMVRNLENKYLEIFSHLNNNIEKLDSTVNDSIIRFLEDNNFNNWQKAFANGYNSSMGNHINYFYNTYISEIGFYNHLEDAKKIVEFAPGDATFMNVFIEMFPEKEFNLIDISEKNLQNIKLKLKNNSNVNYFLNYPEVTELKNIDVVFSFLLSQSMPKSLWISHLSSVLEMLNEGGAYYFQFAYHPDGFANDSIDVAINGGHKYTPEDIGYELEKIGYKGCDFTIPISLKSFNTDIIWYLCKAYK